MRIVSVLLMWALLLLAAPLAGAAEPQPEAGVSWESLSPQQRQLLGNFESKWAQLPPQRQSKLARGRQRT